jgi:universal stress protein E
MGKLMIVADLAEKKYFATQRGLDLADKCGFPVEVVAFTYTPLKTLGLSATEQAAVKQRLLDEKREVVQAYIEKFSKPGQKVTLKVVWEKDIVGWINKRCAKGGYEVVVKTGHRTENVLHTPSDWQLLRECPAAVMLVCDNKWQRTVPVMAALDLSTTIRSKQALNHRIIEAGKDLAQALGTELKLIAAVEVPTLLADLDLVDDHAYLQQAKEKMQPQIKSLSLAHDIPQRAFRIKRGPVEKVITSEAARVRAQVVVMGTRARTGVKARLLGNTAERVLSHLRTDVLAIKP